MKLVVSPVSSQKKYLLLGDSTCDFYASLLHYFKKHEIIVIEPTENYKNSNINAVFLVNPQKNLHRIHIDDPDTKICYVFTSNADTIKKRAQSLIESVSNQFKNRKCVLLATDSQSEETVEKVIWFLFSQSSEKILLINNQPQNSVNDAKHHKIQHKKKFPVIKSIIIGFVLSQLFFIIPLAIGGFYIFNAIKNINVGNTIKAREQLSLSKPYIQATQISYKIASPLFRFIYISQNTDNLLSIQSLSYDITFDSLRILDNAHRFTSLITRESRTPDEQQEIRLRIDILKKSVKKLQKKLEILTGKLQRTAIISKPQLDQLDKIQASLKQSASLFDYLPELLGALSPKKYLVYFFNNMELRPGGGFIGSFAVLTTKEYGVSSFDIYDVYDADGQLKGHLEPPEAIIKYLNQPHLFLRDSHFSPSFIKNIEISESILQKEMPDLGPFDGSVGITTSALANILKAYTQLVLPDSNGVITSENFYLKTQAASEKNYFKGSKAKKQYLASIGRSMIADLENADLKILTTALKQSLDEKHIVIAMKNPALSKIMQKYGWTGTQERLRCFYEQEKCLINYIQAVDANLGVNKANYYISRLFYIKDDVQDKNSITTKATILFKNQSPGDVFPGGTYKNYFQLFIPKYAEIHSVSLNGQITKSYEQRSIGEFSVISVYMIIPPQQDSTFEVTYLLRRNNEQIYQFIIQKQIGSINNELSYEINSDPTDIQINPLNFDTLEKNSSVRYNTSLLKDRVLLLRFK